MCLLAGEAFPGGKPRTVKTTQAEAVDRMLAPLKRPVSHGREKRKGRF